MSLSKQNIISKYIVISLMLVLSLGSCKSGLVISDSKNSGSLLNEKQEMEFMFYLIEGNKYKTLGYLNEALTSFSKCVDINPGSGVANYELANIYIFRNDYHQAIIYSEKALDYDPSNVWYNLLYANLLSTMGDSKQAIRIYENIISENPDNQEFVFVLADFYSNEKRDYPKAIKLLNFLEEKYGVSEELFFEKERIYSKYGERYKIIPEIEKLVDAYPENPRYLGLYAELLMNEGKNEESFQVYKKILEIEPDNPTVHISFGEYYLKNGSVEKALIEFKKSIKNPLLASEIKINLILDLSGYYSKMISQDQIETLVDLLINTHPDISGGHALKAEILLSKGDLEGAGKELQKVVLTDKENYLIWEQLIFIDSELARYSDMYNHSREAISYFPNYPKFLLFNGFACRMLNKYEEGIKILNIGFDMLIDQPDLKVQFLTSLADLYYKNKQYTKSFEKFDWAISLQPTNAGILNNYSYFLALQKVKLPKATTMAKLAVEISPESSTYLDTYAWVLFKAGNYEEAEIMIQKAISFDKSNSAVLVEHYGDILFKLGKENLALNKWKEAAKIGKGSDLLQSKIDKGRLIEE